ncbi:polysialyltransferase family glycosyltransferase [Acinetobacter indicus]|uniref:polysialyltransferase family glycosyltransferase n=1 Tax=Acinetobacter indicus TaxID=756892 RepID=UPI001443B676|nr:polysialyltransferase family glycosyltransferase [Acinetobacter indicus]
MNIYIVESPLQIICAYESILQNKTDYCLYIRLTGRGRNDEQTILCAKYFDIRYKIFKFYPNKKFLHFFINMLFWFELLLKPTNNLYLGSLFSNTLKILRKINKSKKVIYLDDGAATLRAYELMKKKIMPKENLFTFFNTSGDHSLNVEVHNFTEIRKTLVNQETDFDYFIGQPYQHMLGFERADYISCLMGVASKYTQSKPLIYIPHRMEDTQYIEKFKNLKILKLDLPIELYFLKNNKGYPKKIYSCYSSALVTLHLFYPKTEVFAIHHDKSMHSELTTVYNYMERNGIQCLKF